MATWWGVSIEIGKMGPQVAVQPFNLKLGPNRHHHHHLIPWYFIVLHGIVLYLIVVHGIVLYCI